MKASLHYCFFILWISSLYACQKNDTGDGQRGIIARQVDELGKVPLTRTNRDSLLKGWELLDDKLNAEKDSTLSANVKYNMARLYAMKGNDSAKFYVEQALALIEPTKGNLKEKALIYNGMGNILVNKGKRHQANYYYNKAAAIVMADTALPLSAEAKTAFLLAAAQSNHALFQYGLAQQMNRAALALVPRLPAVHTNRQRALVQIIQTMAVQNAPADSIKGYLDRLEALHRQHPGDYNIGYLFESKTKYFERTGQRDSLLYYELRKAEKDEMRYQMDSSDHVAINSLFIIYVNIGGTYVLLNRPAQAESYMQKAKVLLDRHDGRIDLTARTIYKNNLAALYDLEGKKQDGIKLLQQAYNQQKADYESQSTQSIAEMNSLYQLQAKDRSIQTLNENIKINQLQLQQNRLWLIVSVLTVVLLGMGLLFLYYSFRQRRTRQEKEKILLQQQLLRTQMEPHFIFNTLAAVQSFVMLDKKENAIKYLNRFSKLLRSSLELSRETLVPLNEEIETLENYLSLQQMRFDDAFTYRMQYDQDADLEEIMLPPMLIQPYVENAIMHGIDLDKGTGNIDIVFQIEEDMLQVTITDSGKAPTLQTKASHRSLSGTISRERIRFLGKKATITTLPAASGGTVVTLHIPVVFG